MKNAIQNLSPLGQRFYQALESLGGGAWESHVMERMFNKPVYSREPEAQRAFWQWEANSYGHSNERPVGAASVMFNPEPEFAPPACGYGPRNDYAAQVSRAYQELRKAGLAGERNSGYNDYYFYLKGKR